MSQISTFLDMNSAQRTAWFTQLLSFNSTPAAKVKALLFCRRIMQNDRQKTANDAAIVASVDNEIRTKLSALIASDSTIWDSLFPPQWTYNGTDTSIWVFTAAQQTSLGTFLTSVGGVNDMDWYLVNQAEWGRGIEEVSSGTPAVDKYKAIAANPTTKIYGVLVGLVYQHPSDATQNIYGVITNAVLAADSPNTNDSNYWRLALVNPSEFSVTDWGSKAVPSANFTALKNFNTLAWSHSLRTIDATPTQCWLSNSLEPKP